MSRAVVGLACALAVALPAVARPARAQGVGGPRGWSGTADLGGNVYFGAARHRLISATLSPEHVDSALAVRAEAVADYGDAKGEDKKKADADAWRVTVRDARLMLTAEPRPYARLSAFALGGVESSLQHRIAERTRGGAGARLTLWRPRASPRGFAEHASVSLALLAEHTRALDPASATGGVGGRTRWSLGLRYRRQLPVGVRLSNVTFYQPTVGALAERYTVETNTDLGVPLGAGVEGTATLRDRFDSEARRRGARSNHDGRLLFGARLRF